jgi:thioesterase domain-containing protein
VTTDLFDDLLERAWSASLAADAERRGWEAVRMAAMLRKQGEHQRALQLLDEITTHFEHEDVVRAAFACAIAIHCDLDEPETGIVVGRPIWNSTPDAPLGKALVRAYWERAEQTGAAEDRDSWARFGEELRTFDTSAA